MSKALEGNPYDGHTLTATLDQVIAVSGVEPDRLYVDSGYCGHDYVRKERVFIARQRRGLTPTIRRELRRRSAIEPMIGHMKADGRLGRNHLLGSAGDAMNALLVAAGHNLRLILNQAQACCCWVRCSPGQLIRATGYFSGRLKSSASRVQPHYSGPTTYAMPRSTDHDLAKQITTCLTDEFHVDKSRILDFQPLRLSGEATV
ncbi:hypothetical protein AA309_28775 [Microvirga vignae]|uniref:Transposase DDE domain-containing protein n=1 Tax=Microvirga vignae TaxID=1225564 RepID=A0A0H1R527_9HYPH|nr:hypothetical protein AA309_28775 [Microvirga vignae]